MTRAVRGREERTQRSAVIAPTQHHYTTQHTKQERKVRICTLQDVEAAMKGGGRAHFGRSALRSFVSKIDVLFKRIGLFENLFVHLHIRLHRLILTHDLCGHHHHTNTSALQLISLARASTRSLLLTFVRGQFALVLFAPPRLRQVAIITHIQIRFSLHHYITFDGG
jgi:hypothetical protein